MSTKRNSRSQREITTYSPKLKSKMRSTSFLENSLDVGSKNRLRQYRRNLSVTRGANDPNFDDKCLTLIKKYALDSRDVEDQIKYLASLRDADGYLFSRNLKIYSTTEEAMERFAHPDYSSFRWNENYRKSLEQLKMKFSSLKLRPLTYSCDDEIRLSLPKTDTHSGYFWIQSGKKEKGMNMDGIYDAFIKECAVALDEGSFNKPILIGFRTQASGEYDDDGLQTGKCKHKLRVVSMVDLIQIIAELMFSVPIQHFMGNQNFYAGGKDRDEIGGIITNWRVKYSKFLSIDYSSFDQTISSWLIEDVFDVMKSAFILEEEQSRLFDIVMHDFIHKDFILFEGILHSDKGVPSGSMFTQIVDTLVNLLVVNTYFNSIGAEEEMIAMGDDNAIFTNADVSINELASYVMKNFGLIIKTDDKSNEGSTKRDNVKFLSTFWTFAGQWRHPHQLLSRILYPERFRSYSNEVRPEHVIFAFILTYKLGMSKLIDVPRFLQDYPISKSFILDKVDSRYLPGSLAFMREYTWKDRKNYRRKSA